MKCQLFSWKWIQWPSMSYYTVKGEFLMQPICWSLTVEPQPIQAHHDFNARGPIKAFKAASTNNKQKNIIV